MKTALPFNEQTLDAALAESIEHQTIIHLGETPPALLRQGFQQLPVCTSAKLLGKMFYDHGVIRAHLVRLVELIANPVEIYQSEGHVPHGVRTAVILLTPEKKGELPILIPIHGDKLVGRTPTNWVASMYPKDKPQMIDMWRRKGLLLWPQS